MKGTLILAAVQPNLALMKWQKGFSKTLSVDFYGKALFSVPKDHESQASRQLLKSQWSKAGLKAFDVESLMPHSKSSISHSKGICWAVTCPQAAGVGIDVEKIRPMPLDSLRFYCSKDELSSFKEKSLQSSESRLQFWTLKEALFKSDMDNQGCRLSQYSVLEWPDRQNHGVGITPQGELRALFSKKIGKAYFSLSIALVL